MRKGLIVILVVLVAVFFGLFLKGVLFEDVLFSPSDTRPGWLENFIGFRNLVGLSSNSYFVFVFAAAFIAAIVIASLRKRKK